MKPCNFRRPFVQLADPIPSPNTNMCEVLRVEPNEQDLSHGRNSRFLVMGKSNRCGRVGTGSLYVAKPDYGIPQLAAGSIEAVLKFRSIQYPSILLPGGDEQNLDATIVPLANVGVESNIRASECRRN